MRTMKQAAAVWNTGSKHFIISLLFLWISISKSGFSNLKSSNGIFDEFSFPNKANCMGFLRYKCLNKVIDDCTLRVSN